MTRGRRKTFIASAVFAGVILLPQISLAQDLSDGFVDAADGAKRHIASGFVCPAQIGRFERDAAGLSDLDTGAVSCSYSALNGVYGTIELTPLSGPFDARARFAADFVQQERLGATRVVETTIPFKQSDGATLEVFARTYQTARAENWNYRVVFAGSAIRNWAVETTIEYADPRDTRDEGAFLHAVYDAAESQIGGH